MYSVRLGSGAYPGNILKIGKSPSRQPINGFVILVYARPFSHAVIVNCNLFCSWDSQLEAFTASYQARLPRASLTTSLAPGSSVRFVLDLPLPTHNLHGSLRSSGTMHILTDTTSLSAWSSYQFWKTSEWSIDPPVHFLQRHHQVTTTNQWFPGSAYQIPNE